jgi:hypothetical protein
VRAWHGRCYRQGSNDPFPVMQVDDLDDSLMGAEELEVDDPDRFRVARDGDHLMCPFQCDVCHFRNIQDRDPGARHEDALFLMCIRRANLDALWARESATVKGNRGRFAKVIEVSSALGLEEPYPARGPYPEADSFGMANACMLLMRSLDKGKNAPTIQYETMRGLRSHFANFFHTVPGGAGYSTVSDSARGGTFFSSSPTNSYWFRRFMLGCHRRMGDVWIPDRALLIDELLHCLRLLEEDWRAFETDPDGRLQTALTGFSLTAGFSVALRGEELPRMDLGAMRDNWMEAAVNSQQPHVPYVLIGRFKNVTGEKQFFQPVAFKSASGIDNRLWAHRAIMAYNVFGITRGPIFREAGGTSEGKIKRCKMGALEPAFHDVLKRVQERWPHVIAPTVVVEDDYSIRRSLRRGSTTQAGNQEIPREVVEANQRWRKHERSQGVLPSMGMVERYSDAKASIALLVRYSAEL